MYQVRVYAGECRTHAAACATSGVVARAAAASYSSSSFSSTAATIAASADVAVATVTTAAVDDAAVLFKPMCKLPLKFIFYVYSLTINK